MFTSTTFLNTLNLCSSLRVRYFTPTQNTTSTTTNKNPVNVFWTNFFKELHINTGKWKGHQKNLAVMESGNTLLYFWWDVITLPLKEYTMHAHVYNLPPEEANALHCWSHRHTTNWKLTAQSCQCIYLLSVSAPRHYKSQSTATQFQGERYFCNSFS